MRWTSIEIKKFLRHHEVFSTFDDKVLEVFSSCDIQELQPEEILLIEDEIRENHFFLLLEGQLELIKKRKKEIYVLDHLDPGAIIGKAPENREKSYFGTMRAKVLSYCLIIPCHIIDSLVKTHPLLALTIFEKLHNQSLAFLEKVNQTAFQLVKEKKKTGFFVVNVTVILSLFTLGIPYLQKMTSSQEMIFATTPLLFLGSLFLFSRLLATKTSLSAIGLTKKNLSSTISQSIFISVMVIFLLLGGKWILIQMFPQFSETDLFFTYPKRALLHYGVHLSKKDIMLFVLIYPLNVIFQEILARGAIQGFFTEFLDFKHRNLLAIILASLVFAGSYATFGFLVVLAIFACGLFWGWMYYRQKNIVSVIVSHIIIGLTFLGFIGGFD